MDRIDDLKRRQEEMRSKAFIVVFQIIFIFGVPALAAVFSGKWLDAKFETEKVITISLLLASFVLSWVIVIKKYISLSNQMKNLNNEMKEEKNKVKEKGLLKEIK